MQNNSLNSFSDCISKNTSYTIPIGVFGLLSIIGNIYLSIKLLCQKDHRSILESEIELTSIMGDTTHSDKNNIPTDL